MVRRSSGMVAAAGVLWLAIVAQVGVRRGTFAKNTLDPTDKAAERIAE